MDTTWTVVAIYCGPDDEVLTTLVGTFANQDEAEDAAEEWCDLYGTDMPAEGWWLDDVLLSPSRPDTTHTQED